jgi:hypothetical protein
MVTARRVICVFFIFLITGVVTAQDFILANSSRCEKGVKHEGARTSTSIVLSGSSITWGNGNLCNGFSGKVVDYIMNGLSTTLMCGQMDYPDGATEFLNPKQYKGIGKRIDKLKSKIEFELSGDEIAICQSMLRTYDYGVIQIKADGAVIGKFTNHNPTIGENKQLFIGNGSQIKFQLEYSCTYLHEVKVDGKLLTGKINDGGYMEQLPGGVDYLVVRNFNSNQKPGHQLWFRNAPPKGAKITLNYQYGRVILFEGSTVGQTTSDELNESNYGDGKISYDPASPANLNSGMEFRYIDKSAFWVHKFTENKKRHFEIEIIGGINPYFIINFASNRYHDFMNAGIGGWSLSRLLDGDRVNDYVGFSRNSMPDVIVNESATNDDWAFGARKLKRTLTGLTEKQVKDLWTLELDSIVYNEKTLDYTVRVTTGLISGIDEFSLTCPQVVGSNVKKGDIVRIGNYYGDNRQVVCREIASADLHTGKISWIEAVDPEQLLNAGAFDDLVGRECSVRDLSVYQEQYEMLLNNLQAAVPHAKILITQPGLSNYRMRQLWGYDIIHRKLAAKYMNVNTIEVTNWLQAFQENNITGGSSIKLEANGSTGYSLPWKEHWQGFEVWVDNKNVYGKDCYIDGGLGYSVDPAKSGVALNVGKAYDKSYVVKKAMRLVFTQNIPKEGTIEVRKADTVWSNDFCHPNNTGAYVYGQIYVDRITDILKSNY